MVELEYISSDKNQGKTKEKEIESEVNEQCKKNLTPQRENLTFQMQQFLDKLQKLRTAQEKHAFSFSLSAVGSDDCVGVCERDSAVTTIKSMQRFYNYSCDTLAEAVYILDRFLSKVKVKRRYLSCVAAASFFLSTKMNEETEHHPSATDLASLHRNAWKPSDLKRMEKIILDKFDWNLYPSATCLSFIKLIYQMLILLGCNINDEFLKKLIERSELCMNYASISSYNACTLALSIVYQCLRDSYHDSVITDQIILYVQSACMVKDSEMFECQCAISNQLDIYNNYPALYPRCLPMPKIVPRPNLVKRPSFYGNSDLPTIKEVPWKNELVEENMFYDLQQDRVGSRDSSNTYCEIFSQCSILQKGHFLYKTCNIPVF